MSLSSMAVRTILRPMRPKPLMPTLMGMPSSVGCASDCGTGGAKNARGRIFDARGSVEKSQREVFLVCYGTFSRFLLEMCFLKSPGDPNRIYLNESFEVRVSGAWYVRRERDLANQGGRGPTGPKA